MRSFRYASVACTALSVAVFCTPAHAQGPATAGGEFRVNTAVTVPSGAPSVASDAAGNTVVVWQAVGPDGNGFGIFARRYSAEGVPLGAEFRVNTTTAGDQISPAVAMNGSGAFVVAWTNSPDNVIVARMYTSSATATTGEIRVNAATSNGQSSPVIAISGTGEFVISWSGVVGIDVGVSARVYSASGQPTTATFLVNPSGRSALNASVNMALDGSFVITYERLESTSIYQVYARRYSSAGTSLGEPIPVATSTAFRHGSASVSVGTGGAFIVAWQATGQDGSGLGVYARRFSTAGAANGGEFRVNVTTVGDQSAPSVAVDASDNAVVVWQSAGQDGGGLGVYGRRYAADGTPVGGEFRINTYTDGNQYVPSVASSPTGDLTVVWESDGQDGFNAGVYGQRFNRPGVAGEPDADAAALALAVAPNPTSGAAVVRYETAEAKRVHVSVVDVLGRTVAVLVDGEQSAGPHEVALDASRLAAGVYAVRLLSVGRPVMRPFTVAR